MSKLDTAYLVMVVIGFVALMVTLAIGQIATATLKDKARQAD